MTEPARVRELLPGVLGEVVERAGHGYERWAELVAQAGYCHHPIRLAGRVEHADRATGEIRTTCRSSPSARPTRRPRARCTAMVVRRHSSGAKAFQSTWASAS